MTTTPILILSGKGKTGRRVVEQLEARGVPYRLASRSSEQRFDWYDDSTWSATIAGTETAYLAPPVGPTGLAQAGRSSSRPPTKAFAGWSCCPAAASAARVATSPSTRASSTLEDAVKASGADWTIVQPAWFAQGFSEDFLRDYVLAGEIRVSAGDGGEAWIDTNDVGDVMTAVLLDERPHRRRPTRSPGRAR